MYIKGIVALAQAGDNTEAAADAIKQLAEVVKFESAKDYSARNNETKKMKLSHLRPISTRL